MSNPALRAGNGWSEPGRSETDSFTRSPPRITTLGELPSCSRCEQPINAKGVHGLTVEVYRGPELIERVQILTLHEQCAIADLRVAVSGLRRKFHARKDIAVKAFVSFNGFM